MRHLDLFSGIGGFALAAQTVWGDEYENVGFCDNNKFCQQVLKKHWPNAKIYDDIKKLTAQQLIADSSSKQNRGILKQGILSNFRASNKYTLCTPSLGWFYQHFLPDGRELCLESCFGGYCVALYTKRGFLIGEKKCTQVKGIVETFFDKNKRAEFNKLDHMAQARALEIANNMLGYE